MEKIIGRKKNWIYFQSTMKADTRNLLLYMEDEE